MSKHRLMKNTKSLLTNMKSNSFMVLCLTLSFGAKADEDFVYTGSMSTARYAHTASMLPNGKVLVAGGAYGADIPVSSAELYDPNTGVWTTTASLDVARQYHSATLLNDGRVLVAGGATINAISSVELYDPATGNWAVTNSLTTPRQSHVAILLANGKVLVAGGYNVGTTFSTCELYNPATGTWTPTGSLSYPRIHHTVAMLQNGKVLVVGGVTAEGPYHAISELYETASGTWTVSGTLNAARILHTMTLLPNGQPLVAGGSNPSRVVLSSAELYNPGPRIGLIKAVKPSFTALSLGTNYQLQLSGNLINWTNHGSAFTATNNNMIYPQYWDVDNWGSLYFRLKVAP